MTRSSRKCQKFPSPVQYWNGYGKWYKLWREHNNYHAPIEDVLLKFVESGMKILDVGAGDGVLSFPLSSRGCTVTALEPSESMREMLHFNTSQNGNGIRIDPRRFEDLTPTDIAGYDLILASNSLHLTQSGIPVSVLKILASGSSRVFLVTERTFDHNLVTSLYPDYILEYRRVVIAESSFAYHNLRELVDHWRFKLGRLPSVKELRDLLIRANFEEGHIWLKESVTVNLFYWRRSRR